MTGRVRTALALAITTLLLGGAAAYCVVAISGYQARSAAALRSTATLASSFDGDRVAFIDTRPDAAYGLVASVDAVEPEGDREVTSVACDRVYATTDLSMCLRIDRGIVTTFSANLLEARGDARQSWPLPGIPSRTRISPSGELVAFTSFVTGESYGSVAFSTATRIVAADGTDHGNLEEFALIVDGAAVTAADRNFWGVTFADDTVFYATATSGGSTWLVRGDLAARTLTSVAPAVECPSLSPDGTRIAFKQKRPGDSASWAAAVMQLSTGKVTTMPDRNSVDDQIEWLDDDTLLYALPREDAPGDSDVWATAADGSGSPRVFIEHAFSPSVVRR
ncbi:TolB family protein [Conyzicola sp.]|uniref:TolB family protein n=1 Tax=Conyzicola sp. TaxID=1969404 RepID=UPI003988B58A